MEKWILENKKADFYGLAEQFKINPVLIKILVNRGVDTKEKINQYLNGQVSDLHSPYQMKDIEKAADLLLLAANEHLRIGIATDFDNDGLISAHILRLAFRKIGIEPIVYAPDRITEGFGLNERIVEEANKDGILLLITCDNGIAAIPAIEYAKSLGMTVIVTDHHEVAFEETADGTRNFILPPADAIVNPKQEDCSYPFSGLCGAGVVFKLAEVLYERCEIPKEELYSLLSFVAIATVADVMDLADENRILVKEGLKRIRTVENIGLRSLIEVNQLSPEKISAYHIGYILGPCFNAAGRLDTVKLALDLLDTTDKEKADQLAFELKELNDSRKQMTVKGLEQAIERIEKEGLMQDKVLLVHLTDTHESLAGIIAGRLRERYHKPSFVFTDTHTGIKGSGRSIEAYHMFEGLLKCKDLLQRFGGHPMAAGLSLAAENFEALRRQLNEQADLKEQDFIPVVRIDAAMPLGYITEEFIQELRLLEPFGKGNPKPVFAEQHFMIKNARIIGKNQNILKSRIVNQQNNEMEAIFFGDVEQFNQLMTEEFGENELRNMYRGLKNNIDVAFTYYPEINEYMGQRTIQAVLQNYCVVKKRV